VGFVDLCFSDHGFLSSLNHQNGPARAAQIAQPTTSLFPTRLIQRSAEIVWWSGTLSGGPRGSCRERIKHLCRIPIPSGLATFMTFRWDVAAWVVLGCWVMLRAGR
jgi:hypothetical protein